MSGIHALVRAVVRDERVRYLATGAVGAGLFYTVYALGWLISGGRLSAVILVLASNVAVAGFTFRVYRDAVFRSDVPLLSGFTKFAVICLTSVVGSLTLVPLLIDVVGVPPLIAPVLYLAVQPFIYYPINKFWVFRTVATPIATPAATPIGGISAEDQERDNG